MKSNAFDRILTSSPLNATAAKVTARGEHWEPEGQIPPGLKHWKAPPPMKHYEVRSTSPGNVDLTGKKFGRFTVLGLWAETASDGARWVCRCVCGDYEARSSKSIKAAMAGLSHDMSLSFQCYYCYAWAATARRYKKKGAKPISSFVNAAPRVIGTVRPETVISDRIAQLVECDDGGQSIAIDIIRDLNRAGYRITRDPSTLPPADRANSTTD